MVVCASEMPRSAIMITRSLKLNLKLVYQLTQRMMICLSKCHPLNNASTKTNRRILPSSFIVLHQSREDGVERFLVRRKPAVGTRSREDDLRNSHRSQEKFSLEAAIFRKLL